MPEAKARTQMRYDCYIENDSGGFSVLAGSALDRAVEERRKHDRQMALDHEVILLQLEGDDTFPCRVVVDGELTEQEQCEWMARVTWPLEITDGRVLVAGGFDPRVFRSFRDGDDLFPDGVHAFPVANGTWMVDVYTHRATISGRFLDEVWPERLGTWFRREHPGEPFPAWMARELVLSPELDPGHEELWEDVRTAIESGRLAIDPDANSAIGYLVHLRPFDATEKVSSLPEDGWFGSDTGARTPLACPTGLLTEVRNDEVDDIIAAARGEDELEIGSEGGVFDVRAVLGDGPWFEIPGGPVPLPLSELDVAYLLPWLACMAAHPEVWIQSPGEPPASPKDGRWAPAVRDGDWWVYRACLSGAPIGNKYAMDRLTRALEGDTSIIALEMSTAIPEELVDEKSGTRATTARVRLRGAVRNGVWSIDSAAPAVEAAVLEAALSCCRQVLAGKKLTLNSGEEAAAFDAIAQSMSYLITGPIEKNGLERILPEPDSDALGFYASPIFRLRFGSVWECARPMDHDLD